MNRIALLCIVLSALAQGLLAASHVDAKDAKGPKAKPPASSTTPVSNGRSFEEVVASYDAYLKRISVYGLSGGGGSGEGVIPLPIPGLEAPPATPCNPTKQGPEATE
jgi:hypothetical protein